MLLSFFALMLAQAGEPPMNYDALAARIVSALKLGKGERVLMCPDPVYFQELLPPLRRLIRQAGAQEVQTLDEADVYLWLPLHGELPESERSALNRWLEKGGTRREIHFHWSDGSREPDGLPGEHPAAFDPMYQNALDIDYAALSAAHDRAIALLRSGTVRVRTPEGTDLSFRVGDRPFNKQDGDASAARARKAKIPIDREIELPAGVLRVAPLEETVNGRIVVPKARFQGKVARNIRLEIANGRITKVQAAENLDAVNVTLAAGGEAARSFREFCLGFNPKLHALPGVSPLPYYGYGAGVVRLSLGDNQEVGGKVRGNFYRWLFFANATVEVNGQTLVQDGKLED